MKKLLFLLLLLPSLVVAKNKVPAEKNMAGYVMVYHKDQDHGLHMAISQDGYTWTALNNDQPVIGGDIDPVEDVVPNRLLVVDHRLEVPTETIGNLGLQIERGVLHAYQ